MQNKRGFTLIEILVALFIFSIVSMLLAGALRSVISTQSRTEASAAKLNQLQMALLVTSRDIQQAVNRPIVNADGHQEVAFTGNSSEFTFTHMGYASSTVSQSHSVLQRTGYSVHDNGLYRKTWAAVDQAPGTAVHERLILDNVVAVAVTYLDSEGHFQTDWPSHMANATVLPRAVRLSITIADWGTINQVYIVPAGERKNATEQASE